MRADPFGNPTETPDAEQAHPTRDEVLSLFQEVGMSCDLDFEGLLDRVSGREDDDLPEEMR